MRVLSKVTPFSDVFIAVIVGVFAYHTTGSWVVGVVSILVMIFAPSVLVHLFKAVCEGIRRRGRNRRQG